MIMKTINKYLFLLAAVVFGLTACEKQQEREPSPASNSKAVAFEKTAISIEINPSKAALEYEIKMGRSNTDSALTVTINSIGDVNVINVPASVTFAAGASEVVLKLTFPNAQVDSSYVVELSVDSTYQSPYTSGAPKCVFGVSIAAWETSSVPAVFVDGLVNIWFSTGDPTKTPWYVKYESKVNADGSSDYRFFNPYNGFTEDDEDGFGVFDAYPYNAEEDIVEGTYNMTVHVNADGTTQLSVFELGIDWGYGMFSAGSAADAFGVFDADAKTITFPAGTVLCALADYAGGAFYDGDYDFVIYLDGKAYQSDHISISDYNDASIEWIEQETVVNIFESSIFNFTNEEQKLYKAVDQYPGNEKSPFINLYSLKDAYAAGGNFAFYWDGEDGALEIPVPQNTKLSFMGKDLYIMEADGAVVTSDVKGTEVKVFTFNISVASKTGDYVGDFTETFSLANDIIVFDKSDFIGNFKLTGPCQWAGEPDANMDVEIKEEGEGLILLGVDFCDTIRVDFSAETGVISIAPQALGDYGPYDITLYTSVNGSGSTTAVLDMAFGLDGVAKVTKTSEADGYYLVSDAAGGAVDGYYDLRLTPAAPASAPAPAKAPASLRSKSEIRKHAERRTNTPSVSGLSFQGKYRPSLKAVKAL